MKKKGSKSRKHCIKEEAHLSVIPKNIGPTSQEGGTGEVNAKNRMDRGRGEEKHTYFARFLTKPAVDQYLFDI